MGQCGVCEAAQGTVYCFADESLMCSKCDEIFRAEYTVGHRHRGEDRERTDITKNHPELQCVVRRMNVHTRVHGANRLAAKHDRVELGKTAEPVQCDICQDRPAVLFCSEDRALICRRCDIMIHTANEFTQQHHRFLIAGTAIGLHPINGGEAGGQDAALDASQKRPSATNSKASTAFAMPPQRESAGVSTRTSTAGAPGSFTTTNDGHAHDHASSGRMTMASSRNTPASMSSGALVDVPSRVHGGQPSDTWISGRNGGGDISGRLSQDQLNNEQLAAAQGQAGSFGALPGFPSGSLSDFFAAQPSSSNDQTLAQELLGLPAMSQGFSAKDIDAAYLFQDIGDIDDDLSSLLVPDLDFSGLNDMYTPSVKKPAPVQTGGFTVGVTNSPSSATSQDGVVPDIRAPKRQRVL